MDESAHCDSDFHVEINLFVQPPAATHVCHYQPIDWLLYSFIRLKIAIGKKHLARQIIRQAVCTQFTLVGVYQLIRISLSSLQSGYN